MITVKPSDKKEEIENLFIKNGIEIKDTSNCVIAKQGEDVLGFCLYYLDNKRITVLCLEPQNDLYLADGILRSALHVASEHFAMDAHYEGDGAIYEKLGFIKNKADKSLDIDKLFKGCNCE